MKYAFILAIVLFNALPGAARSNEINGWWISAPSEEFPGVYFLKFNDKTFSYGVFKSAFGRDLCKESIFFCNFSTELMYENYAHENNYYRLIDINRSEHNEEKISSLRISHISDDWMGAGAVVSLREDESALQISHADTGEIFYPVDYDNFQSAVVLSKYLEASIYSNFECILNISSRKRKILDLEILAVDLYYY